MDLKSAQIKDTRSKTPIDKDSQKYSQDLDTLNEKLDELLIRMLDLAQDYINLSLQNEKEIKNGFFKLAEARHVMHGNFMSVNNLPSQDSNQELIASSTVKVNSRDDTRSIELNPENEGELRKKFGGLLAPQSLKTAQKSFSSSLQTSVDRLNTLLLIQNAKKEYSDLINERDLIKKLKNLGS